MGVTFHHGTVVGMRCTDELGGGRGRGGASEPFRQVQSVLVSSPASSPASFPAASQSASGEILEIGAGRVVNAAGAFAADVLALAGESLAPLPVRARKRCIFNFHAAAAEAPLPPQQAPLVVDTTGVYFRPEGGGGHYIAGVSPPAERDPDCEGLNPLADVDHALWEEQV